MDLPVDIWDKVGQNLKIQEWAKTCSISQAAYAARKPLVAAEVRSAFWGGQQVSLTQLQLHMWPGCHSIYLDLHQLHEAGELTPEQSAAIEKFSKKAAALHCLHIIGRSQVPLMESSMEGVLMRHLAEHASVLTLHIYTLTMPLDFPSLQHLVLDLGAMHHKGCKMQNNWGPFLSISKLKGLKSLYVQAPDTQIWEATNLKDCVHLQCMVVRGIQFAKDLFLPEACLLHVVSTATTCGGTRAEKSGSAGTFSYIAPFITGLTVRDGSPWLWRYQNVVWGPRYIHWDAPQMRNLKHMRLIVNKEDLSRQYWPKGGLMLPVHISEHETPALEVLELSVQGNLVVFIEGEVPLSSVVLIAVGTLRLSENVWFQGAETTMKQMYLQSGTASFPNHEELAECADEAGLKVRPVEFARQGLHCWTAKMPATFQHSNLQECFCGACPECLARAGVPIMCEQAWTRDGFAKHLRPYCS